MIHLALSLFSSLLFHPYGLESESQIISQCWIKGKVILHASVSKNLKLLTWYHKKRQHMTAECCVTLLQMECCVTLLQTTMQRRPFWQQVLVKPAPAGRISCSLDTTWHFLTHVSLGHITDMNCQILQNSHESLTWAFLFAVRENLKNTH